MNTLKAVCKNKFRNFSLSLVALIGISLFGFSQAETPPYSDPYSYYDYQASYSLPAAVYSKEQSLALIGQSIVSYYRSSFNFDSSVTDEAILQYVALYYQAYLFSEPPYTTDPYYDEPIYSDCVEYPNGPDCHYDPYHQTNPDSWNTYLDNQANPMSETLEVLPKLP